MKFKPLIVKKKKQELYQYFIDHGLIEILKNKNFKKRKVNEMKDIMPYQPELDELYLLHNYIIKFKRMTVLEFGTGWSTLVMANAIDHNKKNYLNLTKNLRMNNAGEIHCLDNDNKWINKKTIKKNKINKQMTKKLCKNNKKQKRKLNK